MVAIIPTASEPVLVFVRERWYRSSDNHQSIIYSVTMSS